ncbi:MAG: hypothetical protein LBS84_11300, partial [Clostridiales bacterium]|nr:hypothetical protein [Clostridiales bacterium]
DSFQELRAKFKIDESLPNKEARKILNLCNMLYLQRYKSWETITIAYEVDLATLSVIEEESKYAGFSAEMQSVRVYPEGKYFSHIVGYTARITEAELIQYEDFSYSDTDLVGKNGIENTYEIQLRGTDGAALAEVTSSQRIVNYLPDEIPAVSGDNVYLTLDRDLQVFTYEILEDMLRDTLINELRGEGGTKIPITVNQFFSSFAKGVSLDLEKIMSASDGSPALALKNYALMEMASLDLQKPVIRKCVNKLCARANEAAKIIKDENFDMDQITEQIMSSAADNPYAELRDFVLRETSALDLDKTEIRECLRGLFAEAVENNQISSAEMLMIMIEQKIITDEGGSLYGDLANGRVSALNVILEKLAADEITPQMTNLDPCTGSVIVTDVNTGNVLAAVGYPSYDSNKLVNKLDYDYFVNINEDPTLPSINRPFKERRAPGSTVKMISAITALESGSITPDSKIHDGITFTSAGLPYLRCWSAAGHGSIDVAHALGVSCNYFFCEAIYRLGNDKLGNKLDSITLMDKYVSNFGLNGVSGVEIGETSPIMPTPEQKKRIGLAVNPNAAAYDLEWHDGDTVQTAIGQGFSNYTAANMNKYILTLATQGRRYQLQLVDSVRGADGRLIEKTRPNLEMDISDISDSTWEAVYSGMLSVTEASNGTGASVFKDFPIRVAGKTGTAQQVTDGSRNDHSSFGGFAPAEDPQIAVYVSIPFGDTKAMPALASQIALKVMNEYFGLDNEPQYPDAVNGLIS